MKIKKKIDVEIIEIEVFGDTCSTKCAYLDRLFFVEGACDLFNICLDDFPEPYQRCQKCIESFGVGKNEIRRK